MRQILCFLGIHSGKWSQISKFVGAKRVRLYQDRNCAVCNAHEIRFIPLKFPD